MNNPNAASDAKHDVRLSEISKLTQKWRWGQIHERGLHGVPKVSDRKEKVYKHMT